jgi:hypothetical protein
VEESGNQVNPNDFLAASQLCHERDFVCQNQRTN